MDVTMLTREEKNGLIRKWKQEETLELFGRAGIPVKEVNGYVYALVDWFRYKKWHYSDECNMHFVNPSDEQEFIEEFV